MPSSLKIASVQPTHSAMCDANPAAVKDFSCGRQPSLSSGSRSRCLRVVCASWSNSFSSASIVVIRVYSFFLGRSRSEIYLGDPRKHTNLQEVWFCVPSWIIISPELLLCSDLRADALLLLP